MQHSNEPFGARMSFKTAFQCVSWNQRLTYMDISFDVSYDQIRYKNTIRIFLWWKYIFMKIDVIRRDSWEFMHQ